MKKILLIGVNQEVYTTKQIIKELAKQKIDYLFVKWGDLCFDGDKLLYQKNLIDFNKFDSALIDIPDYTIIKKAKRILMRLPNELNLILGILKARKIPTVNLGFMLKYPYYNKFTQSFLFSKLNIPHIRSLHLSDNSYEKVRSALETNDLNYPIVAKESEGGMGKEVWKINEASELKKFLITMRNKNLIFQEYIENDGDYRVLVCGKKSLGIMKRIAQDGEWKNNFSLGGKVERHSDSDMEKFAESVCKKLDLDYAGFDIFRIKNNYRIIEINIFASFEGFESIYKNVNISKKIIDFLKKQTIKENRKKI